jgi:hypothetical protein
MDQKYIVYKVTGEPVPDAVVIRRQDVFAPPALDAYANAITVVIESGCLAIEDRRRLQGVADYFHDQAAKSWSEQRKLPD